MESVVLRSEKESRAIMFVTIGPESSSIAKKNTDRRIRGIKAEVLDILLPSKPYDYRRMISRIKDFLRPVNSSSISPS